MSGLIPTIYKKIEPTVVAYQLIGLITVSRRRGQIRIVNGEREIHIKLLNKAQRSILRKWEKSHVSVSYYLDRNSTHVCNISTVPETVSEVLNAINSWAGVNGGDTDET